MSELWLRFLIFEGCSFFFFQAEDGIRDHCVTGVQVCSSDLNPGVDVRLASAEMLPFPDSTFDAAIAQLVVHFMAEPVRGISEMARVVRPGGVVAACV